MANKKKGNIGVGINKTNSLGENKDINVDITLNKSTGNYDLDVTSSKDIGKVTVENTDTNQTTSSVITDTPPKFVLNKEVRPFAYDLGYGLVLANPFFKYIDLSDNSELTEGAALAAGTHNIRVIDEQENITFSYSIVVQEGFDPNNDCLPGIGTGLSGSFAQCQQIVNLKAYLEAKTSLPITCNLDYGWGGEHTFDGFEDMVLPQAIPGQLGLSFYFEEYFQLTAKAFYANGDLAYWWETATYNTFEPLDNLGPYGKVPAIRELNLITTIKFELLRRFDTYGFPGALGDEYDPNNQHSWVAVYSVIPVFETAPITVDYSVNPCPQCTLDQIYFDPNTLIATRPETADCSACTGSKAEVLANAIQLYAQLGDVTEVTPGFYNLVIRPTFDLEQYPTVLRDDKDILGYYGYKAKWDYTVTFTNKLVIGPLPTMFRVASLDFYPFWTGYKTDRQGGFTMFDYLNAPGSTFNSFSYSLESVHAVNGVRVYSGIYDGLGNQTGTEEVICPIFLEFDIDLPEPTSCVLTPRHQLQVINVSAPQGMNLAQYRGEEDFIKAELIGLVGLEGALYLSQYQSLSGEFLVSHDLDLRSPKIYPNFPGGVHIFKITTSNCSDSFAFTVKKSGHQSWGHLYCPSGWYETGTIHFPDTNNVNISAETPNFTVTVFDYLGAPAAHYFSDTVIHGGSIAAANAAITAQLREKGYLNEDPLNKFELVVTDMWGEGEAVPKKGYAKIARASGYLTSVAVSGTNYTLLCTEGLKLNPNPIIM